MSGFPEELASFCDRWFAALDARDTEAVLGLVTDDIVWDDRVFWPEVVHGRAELRIYLDTVWKTTPDYSVVELDRFVNADGTGAVVLWRQTGRAPDHVGTSGAEFSFEGCDVFRSFRGGQLAHYQAGYEIVDMCRQVGLLPAREGRLGAAYLMHLASSGGK